MQVTLNIPDEIPQEIVNKLLIQFEKHIQTVKKSVLKLVQANSDVDKAKAQHDLAQLLNKLTIINEEEISQWMNEVKSNHIDSTWEKEISERVRAVDEGTAIGVDYDEAMQQIEQRFA